MLHTDLTDETAAAGLHAAQHNEVNAAVLGLELSTVGPPGPPGATGAGVPTGGTAGQVLAKASAADYNTVWVAPPSINVKDPAYGAKGDGVTDDTAACQAAINAAGAAPAGGMVFFPAGNYSITTSLVIPNAGNITIRGSGWATLFSMTGPWLASGLGLFTAGDVSHAVPNLVFEDFRVDGLKASKAGTTTSGGINLRNVNRARVHRIYFKDVGYQTCSVGGGSDVVISECHFDSGGDNVHAAVSNHVSLNTSLAPLTRVAVTGNTSLNAPDAFCEVDNQAQNIVIANNVINTPVTNAINIAGGRQVSITGNTINCGGVTPVAVTIQGYVSDSAFDVTVSGNQITGPGASATAVGVQVSGTTGFAIKRVAITGNEIFSMGVPVQVHTDAVGTVSQVIISGNLIDSAGYYGIMIDNTGITAVSITGNMITNCNNSGAIYIVTTLTNLLIGSNYLLNNIAVTNLTLTQKQTHYWFNNVPQDTVGVFRA